MMLTAPTRCQWNTRPPWRKHMGFRWSTSARPASSMARRTITTNGSRSANKRQWSIEQYFQTDFRVLRIMTEESAGRCCILRDEAEWELLPQLLNERILQNLRFLLRGGRA